MSSVPRIEISVNGRPVSVPADISVAAALAHAGRAITRRDVAGEPRSPVCGMGVCQECAVTIDGLRGRLACMTRCRHGMEIELHV